MQSQRTITMAMQKEGHSAEGWGGGGGQKDDKSVTWGGEGVLFEVTYFKHGPASSYSLLPPFNWSMKIACIIAR